MAENKSIVDQITAAFLEKMHSSDKTACIATEVSQLITQNEKPKAGDFVAIYQSKTSEKAISE